jgi:hypothetical protein
VGKLVREHHLSVQLVREHHLSFQLVREHHLSVQLVRKHHLNAHLVRECHLNTHFHPVSRLRTSEAIPLLPLYCFMMWTGTALPLPFTFYLYFSHDGPYIFFSVVNFG